LLGFLEHLAGDHDQVVLLGDVCQADFGWRLGQDPRVVAEVERRYRCSFELIRTGPFVQVEGNHDRTLADPPRFPLQILVEHEGWRVLFEHGHRFDRTVLGLLPGKTLERDAEGLLRDKHWDLVVVWCQRQQQSSEIARLPVRELIAGFECTASWRTGRLEAGRQARRLVVSAVATESFKAIRRRAGIARAATVSGVAYQAWPPAPFLLQVKAFASLPLFLCSLDPGRGRVESAQRRCS